MKLFEQEGTYRFFLVVLRPPVVVNLGEKIKNGNDGTLSKFKSLLLQVINYFGSVRKMVSN